MKNLSLFHIKFEKTLKEKSLLPKKSNVLIAVSGGQDSLCLGKLVVDLQDKWQWNLAVAHCDHGWEADKGLSSHVEKIVGNWQIPFHLATYQGKMPETEAAARKWRYQALIEIAQKHHFEHIITAHTMSDRSETFLYNLIRGAGSSGLSALVWQRNLTDKIKLTRPLLNFSRQETLEFCQQFQLPIWEDIYNSNKKYARNRIRLDLIPYLKEKFNPQVEKNLAQTAEILKAEVEYLETITQEICDRIAQKNKLEINRFDLREYPLALQRRIMRKFFKENLGKDANFEQIEALVKLINANNKARTSTLVGKQFAEVKNHLIIFTQ